MTHADASKPLMLDIQKRIQAGISDLKAGLRMANQRLTSIDTHMAGFHGTARSHSEEIESIKERIDRIECRLDLAQS